MIRVKTDNDDAQSTVLNEHIIFSRGQRSRSLGLTELSYTMRYNWWTCDSQGYLSVMELLRVTYQEVAHC